MPSKNLRTDSEWVSESLSHVRLFAAPWTKAYQASLPMEFPRQEYWSGLPFPSSRNLFHPGIEPLSPTLAGGFFTAEPPDLSVRWISNLLWPHSHLTVTFSPSSWLAQLWRWRTIESYRLLCFYCSASPVMRAASVLSFLCSLWISSFLPFPPPHPPVFPFPTSSFFKKKKITSFFFFVTFIFVYQGFLFSHPCSLGTSICMVKVPPGNAQN